MYADMFEYRKAKNHPQENEEMSLEMEGILNKTFYEKSLPCVDAPHTLTLNILKKLLVLVLTSTHKHFSFNTNA